MSEFDMDLNDIKTDHPVSCEEYKGEKGKQVIPRNYNSKPFSHLYSSHGAVLRVWYKTLVEILPNGTGKILQSYCQHAADSDIKKFNKPKVPKVAKKPKVEKEKKITVKKEKKSVINEPETY